MTTKIVVSGSPNGQFKAVFTKLNNLHAKNSFSFAIVLGDVFSLPASTPDEDSEDVQLLLRGEIKVALPTYFTLGTQPLPQAIQQRIDDNDGEVCENLFFLGKRSTLSTSEGVKIVALGGRLDAGITGTSKEQKLPFYSEQDAATLKGANYADLLVTQEWPEGAVAGQEGLKPLAKLADGLRPRYHLICGGDKFVEREPYRNPAREKDGPDAAESITRLIALADYGNINKAKWMYAFSLNLKEPVTAPPNTTSSPYAFLSTKKRSHESSSTFFWGETPRQNDHHHGRKKTRHQESRPPPGPDSCFFCLSNPNLAKHLISSIGSESYITTAKGPLTTSSTNAPQLNFPGHVLIIPFQHSPTLQAIDDAESQALTIAEMQKYRSALEKMYESHGCGTVTFEVVRRVGIHTHWQVVPISNERIKQVESTFVEMAKEEEGAEEAKLREAQESDEGDYLRIWVYLPKSLLAAEETSLHPIIIPLKERVRFDLQFGRKVLAKVLQTPDRIHWKDCNQTVDEEAADVGMFKEAFKDFDFSLEE